MFNVKPSGKMFEVYNHHTSEVMAMFPDEEAAESYKHQLTRRSEIDCCETSLRSSGWHHCHGCNEEPSYIKLNSMYRMYYNISGCETHFRRDDNDINDWWCTHGEWYGTVKKGDELTLHHAYGKSTYDSYIESDKVIPFKHESKGE